jgi:DsbC/DsbD-like thiol-disulfide interchange protein
MKRFFLSLSILLTLSVFTAHAQSLSGSIGNGTVERGATTRASVVLNIPGGIHVNSFRPNSEYAIPTTVRVSANGVKLGAITYPRGRNRKFAFSENAINVYEGRVAFGFNVTVPANYKGSSVRVNATVRYQACTNDVCYPPRTKPITLTARVR